MLIKNASVEVGRFYKQTIVVGLEQLIASYQTFKSHVARSFIYGGLFCGQVN